jgi:protein TonB
MYQATLFTLLLFAAISCAPKGSTYYEAGTKQNTKTSQSAKSTPVPVYYMYENGIYTETKLDKEPSVIGGKEAMGKALLSGLTYPPKAREARIQGTVLIAIVVDASGRMEEAKIRQGIGGGCDEEALRAVKRVGALGFEPAIKNGQAVKVKYDMPVLFSLP